jgi:hypothetical protein
MHGPRTLETTAGTTEAILEAVSKSGRVLSAMDALMCSGRLVQIEIDAEVADGTTCSGPSTVIQAKTDSACAEMFDPADRLF